MVTEPYAKQCPSEITIRLASYEVCSLSATLANIALIMHGFHCLCIFCANQTVCHLSIWLSVCICQGGPNLVGACGLRFGQAGSRIGAGLPVAVKMSLH